MLCLTLATTYPSYGVISAEEYGDIYRVSFGMIGGPGPQPNPNMHTSIAILGMAFIGSTAIVTYITPATPRYEKLSDEQISQLQKVFRERQDPCFICQDPLTGKDEHDHQRHAVVICKNLHFMHPQCLDSYVNHPNFDGKCAICRTFLLAPNDRIGLYQP